MRANSIRSACKRKMLSMIRYTLYTRCGGSLKVRSRELWREDEEGQRIAADSFVIYRVLLVSERTYGVSSTCVVRRVYRTDVKLMGLRQQTEERSDSDRYEVWGSILTLEAENESFWLFSWPCRFEYFRSEYLNREIDISKMFSSDSEICLDTSDTLPGHFVNIGLCE